MRDEVSDSERFRFDEVGVEEMKRLCCHSGHAPAIRIKGMTASSLIEGGILNTFGGCKKACMAMMAGCIFDETSGKQRRSVVSNVIVDTVPSGW